MLPTAAVRGKPSHGGHRSLQLNPSCFRKRVELFTHGCGPSAKRLRIFAGLAWIVAIGTEIAGIVFLKRGAFDHGNLGLLIGLLVVIAVFAIAGSLMWKKANTHDPASRADAFRFFVQNQLGAIITLIAFLLYIFSPLLTVIFNPPPPPPITVPSDRV